MADKKIDTTNYCAVSADSRGVRILRPVVRLLKEEALVHAAWLIAYADDSKNNEMFLKTLAEVKKQLPKP